MAEKLLSYNLRRIVWVIVAVGALNWGLLEFVDTDLLVDVLSLSGQSLTVAYAVIGGAAAVNLYNIGVNLTGDMG